MPSAPSQPPPCRDRRRLVFERVLICRGRTAKAVDYPKFVNVFTHRVCSLLLWLWDGMQRRTRFP